ncbi:MAG: ATP-binding cassette domain-containing protein [Bacteroidota bacterium]|nr:ATP-binding cassette domain-containing protein [Bacteroidota bacterium]
MDSKKLVVDSIVFRYATKEILRGIYFDLELGSICGLYGINGSGKTTLIKIIAGLLKPASGSIFIAGKVFNSPQLKDRFSQISFLSQESFLPDDLRVKDLIRHFPKDSEQLLADEMISKYLNQKIYSLSTGERRYIEVRLILSLQRPFVLLDEPFTGLEPIKIEKVVQLLQKEKENGRGILLTDHYRQYVSSVIDRAYLLNEGYCKTI